MASPLFGSTLGASQDALLAFSALFDNDSAGASGTVDDAVHTTDVGAFMRLHLDASALAAYDSPSFDEAIALSLDALPSLPSSSTPAAPHPVVVKTERLEERECGRGAAARTGWTQSATSTRPMLDAMRCGYRKGKCANLRTLKKNGGLHSYCEFHRVRSVLNQRRFDSKKRAELAKCTTCVGSTKARDPDATAAASAASARVPTRESRRGPSDGAVPIKPAPALRPLRLRQQPPRATKDDASRF